MFTCGSCTVYPKKYAHGLCFVVVIHWLIFPYPSGLLHWHCGNLTIAPVPAKQPWWIWINTSCEFIMNDCITTTKQSTTKPCAYFLGYTVFVETQNLTRRKIISKQRLCGPRTTFLLPSEWASKQIRKIAGYACAGNAGNVFIRHRLQRKSLVCDTNVRDGTCVTYDSGVRDGTGHHARRNHTWHDACQDRFKAVAEKTFPAFPAQAQPAILRIW